MHDRITVGFDASTAADAALRWAIARAESTGATIVVVSSYAMPSIINVSGIAAGCISPAEIRAERERCLNRLSLTVGDVLVSHAGCRVYYEAFDTPTAAMLLDEAKRSDLLVLGAHGPSGFVHRRFLSSSTEALHRSPCPVVVVPAERRAGVHRIVVGVDGTSSCDSALQWAVDEANRSGSDLTLVHAWRHPHRSVRQRGAAVEARAEAILTRSMEQAQRRSTRAVHGLLVQSPATSALVEASAQAAVIVVGSGSTGRTAGALFGSCTGDVVQRSLAPVVVVRPAPSDRSSRGIEWIAQAPLTGSTAPIGVSSEASHEEGVVVRE